MFCGYCVLGMLAALMAVLWLIKWGLSTTVALLMPAGITAVGSGIFGLWPGASVSIATSQAQNQRNSLASIPGG